MFITIVGTGAVGAGATSRYGSGSDQKMRLLAAPCGSGSATLQKIINPCTSKLLSNEDCSAYCIEKPCCESETFHYGSGSDFSMSSGAGSNF
jgi:hypothetical protein